MKTPLVYELNLGLHINGGDNSEAAVALRAAQAEGAIRGFITGSTDPNALVVDTYVKQSETEPTVVAIFTTDILYAHVLGGIYMLAEHYKQDCVALLRDSLGVECGQLIGPNAAAWGEFNPEFFIRY